jgi:hypothetical protein
MRREVEDLEEVSELLENSIVYGKQTGYNSDNFFW